MKFKFEIVAKDKDSRARAGIIYTTHGNIETPYVVPVATRGYVNLLNSHELEKYVSPQALLANTYHLHFKKENINGRYFNMDEIIKKLGGLHKFMCFDKPVITDSGGFQVFSLGFGKIHKIGKIGFFPENKTLQEDYSEGLTEITEDGVKFRSTYNNEIEFIGPKESMEIQSNLGADIIMAFDECTSPMHDKDYNEKALKRTHKWAIESLRYRDKKQALYGIVQGGWFEDLRKESARFINSHPFDGIAIGGSLGKYKHNMYEILDWTIPLLDDRPRHFLGIGYIEDLIRSVEKGIDTFDCVHMTRIARHDGTVYISPGSGGNIKNRFEMKIKQNNHGMSEKPIDNSCECYTCKNFSLKQLTLMKSRKNEKGEEIKEKEQSEKRYKQFMQLTTIHNLFFTQNLMSKIRKAIIDGRFCEFKKVWIGE